MSSTLSSESNNQIVAAPGAMPAGASNTQGVAPSSNGQIVTAPGTASAGASGTNAQDVTSLKRRVSTLEEENTLLLAKIVKKP